MRESNVDMCAKRALWRTLAALLLAVTTTGCAVRRAPSPDVLKDAAVRGFIDLQPGWRIKVVTPILKSGGYFPNIAAEKEQGNIVRLSSDADLVGYETSYYSVKQRKDQGVKVEIASVLLTKESKTTRQDQPVLQLFNLPSTVRFVRLLYLLRVSGADHDMAIAGANTPGVLDEVTAKIQADPTEQCVVSAQSYCRWVPKGVGVRVESPNF
jgi:hypothetical protein